jgi:hypothetical protein
MTLVTEEKMAVDTFVLHRNQMHWYMCTFEHDLGVEGRHCNEDIILDCLCYLCGLWFVDIYFKNNPFLGFYFLYSFAVRPKYPTKLGCYVLMNFKSPMLLMH